jgi:hypothetical protein
MEQRLESFVQFMSKNSISGLVITPKKTIFALVLVGIVESCYQGREESILEKGGGADYSKFFCHFYCWWIRIQITDSDLDPKHWLCPNKSTV